MNNEENVNHEEDTSWWLSGYNAVMVAVAVVILLVILGLVQFFFESAFMTTVWVALAIWAVVYFGVLFGKMWIKVPGNHGVILFNSFKPIQGPQNSEQDDASTAQTLVPRNQRGVGSGWHAKLPWETVLGEPIEIVKSEPINFEITEFDGEDVPWRFPVTFSMTPLNGRWLPRYKISNFNLARDTFKKVIERKAQKHIRERKTVDILMEVETIRNEISHVFDGPLKVHDDEIAQGYHTGFIEVGSPKPSQKVSDAMESKKESEYEVAGINAMAAAIAQQGGREAADLFMAMNAKNARVVVIRGLEGIDTDSKLGAEIAGRVIEEGLKGGNK